MCHAPLSGFPLRRHSSCENELRLCFLNDGEDSEMQRAISAWHSVCDSHVNFSPTTPSISSLTTTYDNDYCGNVVGLACESEKALLEECSNIINDATKFSSCTCQPQILKYDYTCEYLANISCYETGATLSSMWPYSLCDNFGSIIGSGLVSGSDI